MSTRPVRLAVVCAGQGEQGDIDFASLAPRSDDPPEIATLWEQTGRCVDAEWSGYWQALDARARRSNRHAQLAVVLYQSVRWLRIRALLPRPSWVLGYSVGELTAHAVAGSLEMVRLPSLADARAAAMDAVCPSEAGASLILLAGRLPPGARARRDALLLGLGLTLAIDRSPQEQVWGGDARAVASFLQASQQAGWGARAVGVNVPSHTPAMAGAQVAWRAALATAVVHAPVSGVLAGINASPVRTAEAVIETLVRQVAEPIRWSDCIEAMAEHGVTHLLDLGPGRDQSRLAQESMPHLTLLDADTLQDFPRLHAGRSDA